MNHLSKIWAFIRKDFVIESSYKTAFFISLVNSCIPVLSFFFVGRLIRENDLIPVGSYFEFALVGVVFSSYFISSVTVFSSVMRRAQMSGCLEAILSSQTGPKTVVLYSSFYSFASASVQVFLAVTIGVVFFKFDYTHINVFSTLVVLMLSLIIFISLGIIAAASTIVFKQGEPFGWVMGTVSSFLGGAYFPVSIMPEWLRVMSKFIPVSYVLDALRLSIIRGTGLSGMPQQVIVLAMMALAFLPFSLYIFHRSVEKGKRDGTLMFY